MEESAQSPHVFPSSRFPTTPATTARAHLNGLTIRLRPQIQKLEPCTLQNSIVQFEGETVNESKNFFTPVRQCPAPLKIVGRR